jgi:hypothetical protein
LPRFLLKLLCSLVPLFALSARAGVPSAEIDASVPPECRWESLERQIISYGDNMGRQEVALQQYFHRCERKIRNVQISPYLTYIKQQRANYDYLQNRNVREVVFRDREDGTVVRAHLALQPGRQKYPLVIFQCGALCNLSDPSMRYMMMLLYDASPFHVLAIPSVTGTEFQADNGYFTLGGLDEGRKLYRVSKMVASSRFQYADRVSRVHLVGMSLGGHATLYASLYADHDEDENPLFSTVIAGCPMIDLEPSFNTILRGTIVGRFFKANFLDQFLSLFTLMPIWQRLVGGDPGSYKPDREELKQLLRDGALAHYQERYGRADWSLPPFEGERIRDYDDVWRANRFQNVGLPQMKHDVFVWAPQNDEVVFYEENSKQLFAAARASGSRYVHKLETGRGNHCLYSHVYGWGPSVAVFRGLLLARSPELTRRARTHRFAFPWDKVGGGFRISSGERRTKLEFEATEGSDRVVVRQRFDKFPCNQPIRGPFVSCTRADKEKMRLSDFGLGDEMIPTNEVEAQRLSRWLNLNLRLFGAQWGALDPRENPASVEFTAY